MKKVIFIIFILSALTAKASENPLLQYIPDITADGQWQVDFEPELYTPENLFEYINGEAEHYIDYHFKHMLTASWINVDDEARNTDRRYLRHAKFAQCIRSLQQLSLSQFDL